ncbi:ATP-dependent Zn protease [Pseudanabaenaceae cyanobacterium LEGE 13415]|nr:ATP-dependent Zn protease [Pseudanabaenaceae cyanobacterium LEGE 13415]
MNQTALNLVAIGIFTMTMTTLLSPILHISPAIPALATFSILGLATLDSFQWQGKFGSIALDFFARFSSEHRDRVLRHEAGHFLAAQQLEIPVVGYTLSAWEAFRQGQSGLGGVQFNTEELEAELKQNKLSAQLVERYCTVWMSGIAAEQIAYGNSEGGNDDRQKFRETLTKLGIPASELPQRERLSILRAKELLQRHESAYEALVEALREKQSIEQCYSAIQNAG